MTHLQPLFLGHTIIVLDGLPPPRRSLRLLIRFDNRFRMFHSVNFWQLPLLDQPLGANDSQSRSQSYLKGAGEEGRKEGTYNLPVFPPATQAPSSALLRSMSICLNRARSSSVRAIASFKISASSASSSSSFSSSSASRSARYTGNPFPISMSSETERDRVRRSYEESISFFCRRLVVVSTSLNNLLVHLDLLRRSSHDVFFD